MDSAAWPAGSHVLDIGFSLFCIVNQPGEFQNHRYFWQEMSYAGLIQSSIGAGFRSWIAKRLEPQ